MSKIRTYGITGGVGAGKSTVLSLIRDNYSALIIMADNVARELMSSGKEGFIRTIEIFGENVIGNDGQLDRSKIADIIFVNPKLRLKLNSAIHPLVKESIKNTIAKHKRVADVDYIFVEAALLLEDHYDEFLDEIWCITAETSVRRRRLKESRGYSDEKIDNILSSQLTDEQFISRCTHVIDNSGSIETTLGQIRRLLNC